MQITEHVRRRPQRLISTKVQIPAFEDAILKIKRFWRTRKTSQGRAKSSRAAPRRKHDRKDAQYSFVLYHRDYEAFLTELQKLGVLHLIRNTDAKTESLVQNLELIGTTQKPAPS